MIKRIAEKRLLNLAKSFKAVFITGPRQSGKTTLVKNTFPNKPYLSLENPDTRRFAKEDPRGFLETYKKGAILDEAQRVPELFSYLQEVLDNTKEKGLFILTGSNNFLLYESITQSLAGRIAIMTLLPFSTDELKSVNLLPDNDNLLILNGFYPPIYDQKIKYSDWYPNYITTYIEKDVRLIKNIMNFSRFERFLSILAGRCSQELNMSAISNEVGIDVKTVHSWISILEASFIVYKLKPHYKNFKKTIVKRPKLYFYDSGLVCSLLNIQTIEHLINHPLRGALFENMVVSEFIKYNTHRGLPENMYYWRDKTGHEIDLIIDNTNKLIPIEIKSGMTINEDFFKNLKFWKRLTKEEQAFLLYSGKFEQQRSDGIKVMNWRNFFEIFN